MPLVDTTPLVGPVVDVMPRTAWLLRVTRHAAGVRRDDLAAPLGTTAGALRELESGRRRSGRLVQGYERALGLPPGRLGAPIDIAYRAFAEAEADPDPPPALPRGEAQAIIDAVADGGPRTGSDWLRWAQLQRDHRIPVGSTRQLRALIAELVSEFCRSSGATYILRYEALVALRSGPAAGLVMDVVADWFDDPDVQVTYVLGSVVAEIASAELWHWSVAQLADPRPQVVHAGVVAIENMVCMRDFDPRWWHESIDRIIAHHDAAGDRGTAIQSSLAQLVRLAPDDVLRGRRLRRTLPPRPGGANPAVRGGVTTGWKRCERVATSLEERLGYDSELLARLLFDVVLGTSEVRAITSGMLLSAAPHTHLLVESIGNLVGELADLDLRAQGARRLLALQTGHAPLIAHRWLRGDPSVVRPSNLPRVGTALLAEAGHAPPYDVLVRMMSGSPPDVKHGLRAAGLTGSPALGWALEQGGTLAAGAGWWRRTGELVRDEEPCADCAP